MITTYRRSCCPGLSNESWSPSLSSLSYGSSRSCWSGRSYRSSWPWKSWSSRDTSCAVRSWGSWLSCEPSGDNNRTAGWDTGGTSRTFRSYWTGFSGWTCKRCGIYQHIVILQWRHNECDGVSNHQFHDCWLNRLFGRRSKKTSKLRVTGLCAGNSPGTGDFSAQMASNAENVSIWWRHHVSRQNDHHYNCQQHTEIPF